MSSRGTFTSLSQKGSIAHAGWENARRIEKFAREIQNHQEWIWT
jgi:hypothetical protein